MDTRVITLKKVLALSKLVFVTIFFVGCWTNESNIKVVESLKYGYKIITDSENSSEGYQLVLDIGNGDNTSFRIMEKNCISIVFDSSKIYIKSAISDTTSKYTVYKISSLNHTEYSKADVKENDFFSMISNCKGCNKASINKLH